MSRIRADGTIARRISPEKYAIRIALVLGDVRSNPFDNAADVLGRLVPSQTSTAETTPALHIHTGHSVFQGPEHDVVVESVAIRPRNDLVSATAGNVNQDWTIGPALFRSEDIHDGSGIRCI